MIHLMHPSTPEAGSKGFSNSKMMPSCSPDLNPIKNLCALLKRETYRQEKQYTSLNSLWGSVLNSYMTECMDNRLLQVLEKKDAYIGY